MLFHPRFQRFESTTGFFLQQVGMHPFHPVGDEKPQDFGGWASFALGRLFKGNFKLSANSCLNQLVKHVITKYDRFDKACQVYTVEFYRRA